MRGGPAGGLIALVEVEPGHYQAQRPGYSEQFVVQIDGEPITYEALRFFVPSMTYTACVGALITVENAHERRRHRGRFASVQLKSGGLTIWSDSVRDSV